MCVKMYNMKTATVRQIQHNLNEVLGWVENGEEVHVFRRRKLVAKLVPAVASTVDSPDFLARAEKVWGERPGGKPLSEIVSEDRGER